MESTEALTVSLPTQLCGCRVARTLTPDQSYLATGPGGRAVVIKKIDPDCLLNGHLHPHVRDRLGRVRELAHPGVANLFSVERDGDDAYLTWEHVGGQPFDAHVADDRLAPRDLANLARELVMSVELLHAQGIVHGALVPNNVFIGPGGAVRLTHVSPLLYTDPAVDIACVLNLLDLAAELRGPQGADVSAVVSEARAQGASLRQLAARLGGLVGPRDARPEAASEPEPRRAERRRALLGAAVATLVGLGLAWGVWRAVEGGQFTLPDSLRLPFHKAAE